MNHTICQQQQSLHLWRWEGWPQDNPTATERYCARCGQREPYDSQQPAAEPTMSSEEANTMVASYRCENFHRDTPAAEHSPLAKAAAQAAQDLYAKGWLRAAPPKVAESILTSISRHLAVNEREELIAALRDIAIPSLRYCEQKYDHDDQARLNLEAVLERVEGKQ